MQNSVIIDRIRSLSRSKTFPDQIAYRSISVAHVSEIAQQLEIGRQEIEIATLGYGVVPERYARNMKIFSLADQIILLKSCVSVVGLGGLGGTVTEILARLGIGTLNLIDGDHFEDNNLNRQMLSSEALLGTAKATAAAQRVQSVNASVMIRSHETFLDAENAAELLEASDVIVDCLDSIPARFVLETAARNQRCPLVSAAIGGAAGQVTTIFPEDTGLEMIYGPPDKAPKHSAEDSLGTLAHCVTLIASLECSEVIKILLDKGSLLRHKLHVVDLMHNHHEEMQFL
jgi:molybdopterin/thiamine biosynthesis adenylyltransferase